MDGNIQDRPTKDASARRRLIRGAFTAPAVMTLYCGSAFAATSNMRCVSNQVSNPSFPGVGPADTWMRVQRYKLWLNNSTTGTEYWVKGSDVVALRGAKVSITTYLGTNQFHKLGTSPIFTTTTPPTSGNRGLEIDPDKFVAVRVDRDGNIVGVVESTTGTGSSAVANTCWTSFRIGAG